MCVSSTPAAAHSLPSMHLIAAAAATVLIAFPVILLFDETAVCIHCTTHALSHAKALSWSESLLWHQEQACVVQ